jgi:hypothetical protein
LDPLKYPTVIYNVEMEFSTEYPNNVSGIWHRGFSVSFQKYPPAEHSHFQLELTKPGTDDVLALSLKKKNLLTDPSSKPLLVIVGPEKIMRFYVCILCYSLLEVTLDFRFSSTANV